MITIGLGLGIPFGNNILGGGAPTLGALSLSPNLAYAGVAFSGTISGRTTGSTLAATSSDSTSLTVNSTTGVVTGTFSGVGSPTLTLTETLAGATNSPKSTLDTTFVVYPVLQVLALSPLSATMAVAFSGTISNCTTGSTVAATSSDSTTLTVTGSGTTRTVAGTFASAGSPTLSLVETLTGASGSPKTTPISFTVNTAFAGMLDSLSVAPVAAYSLRLLRSAYSGHCINVRRDSDNTTLDIGFVTSGANKVLDVASMQTFVGAGNGYITKFYDQMGGGATADIIQTGTTQQPLVCASGVAVKAMQNSVPCFGYTSAWVLGIASSIGPLPSSYSDFSFVMACEWHASQNFLYQFSGSIDAYVPYVSGQFYWDSPGANRIGPTASAFTTAVGGTVALVAASNAGTIYFNGASFATGTTGSCSPTEYQFNGAVNGTYNTEMIVFAGNHLTSGDISSIHTSQSAYFGTP